MKANNKKQVFKDLKTLKTLRHKIKPQQTSVTAGDVFTPVKNNNTQASPAKLKLTHTKQQAKLSKKKAPLLTTSDQNLFLQAVKDVKPLKSSQSRHHKIETKRKKQIALENEQFKRRQQHALGQNPLPYLQSISDFYSPDYDEQPRRDYLNPLCGTDVLRNLKKQRWPITSSIDLHGATLDQARLRLEYFLQHSLAEKYKCVRVVHGIGYGSKENGPVLPTAVRRWLSQLDFVLAYTDCAPREGGEGAVKVLLRTTAHFSI